MGLFTEFDMINFAVEDFLEKVAQEQIEKDPEWQGDLPEEAVKALDEMTEKQEEMLDKVVQYALTLKRDADVAEAKKKAYYQENYKYFQTEANRPKNKYKSLLRWLETRIEPGVKYQRENWKNFWRSTDVVEVDPNADLLTLWRDNPDLFDIEIKVNSKAVLEKAGLGETIPKEIEIKKKSSIQLRGISNGKQ